jgi:hypothetical protein
MTLSAFSAICGRGKKVFNRENYPDWPEDIPLQRPSKFSQPEGADHLRALWKWVCTVGGDLEIDWGPIHTNVKTSQALEASQRKSNRSEPSKRPRSNTDE